MGQVDVDGADKNLRCRDGVAADLEDTLFPSLRARYVLSNRAREKIFPLLHK